MATIITRAGKGSPLTQAEVDQNFINLNTDKLDTSGVVSVSNWNFPGLLLRRTASNVATAKQISFLLDGDTESDTTLTNYLNIWGTYSGTPTTSSTSTGLSASMNLGAPNAFIAHTNGSERLRITSAGLVGIGTNSPQQALHVSQSGGNNFAGIRSQNINTGTGTAGIEFSSDSTYAKSAIGLVRGDANGVGSLVFYNASSTGAANWSTSDERARIDSSGNMFFNTTVNPNTINATGLFNILQDKAGRDVINLKHTVDGNNSINIWQTGTASFNALTFYKGNTQTGVGGISVSTTATSYLTSSDYRLKENIVSLTGAVERLNQLQVHRFNFLADPNHTVDGFIAHEAQAVVPECVTGEKDAVDSDGNPVYQGIDQSKMVPLAIAAIQECVKRIEALESEVALLKAKP